MSIDRFFSSELESWLIILIVLNPAADNFWLLKDVDYILIASDSVHLLLIRERGFFRKS
jgi:hypothetical protein